MTKTQKPRNTPQTHGDSGYSGKLPVNGPVPENVDTAKDPYPLMVKGLLNLTPEATVQAWGLHLMLRAQEKERKRRENIAFLDVKNGPQPVQE